MLGKYRVWDKARKEYFNHGELHLDMNGNIFLDGGKKPCNDRFDIEWYTGLKDKNGVEIYEGSVVQGSYHKPYPIVFEDGAFGYMGEECFLDMDFEQQIEVIGTIHTEETK
jgi:hypothetical protein